MDAAVRSALGPLATVVTDDVSDVCVAATGRVWVRGNGRFDATDLIITEREARHIGVGLVELGGGRVDDARPVGDAALAGNLRVHVALPPIARGGPTLSIRFPRPARISTSDYVVGPDFPWETLAGESILISGVTGSGKSTLAEVIMGRLDPNERVVILEDIAELSPDHPHRVHLVTRPPNPEGAGAVALSALVRESLRMSPDRIVVGEIRGAEIVELLLAATSGHRGLATVHARDLDSVPRRLRALGFVAGLNAEAVSELVATAFDRVIHCERTDRGVELTTGRFVMSGGELRVLS